MNTCICPLYEYMYLSLSYLVFDKNESGIVSCLEERLD